MKRETKKQLMSIFVLLVFSGSIVTYALLYIFPQQEKQTNWRARLIISIFEQPQIIPAGIGVVNETKAKLYTLDDDGIIYKTVQEDVTLGDFFEIWGKNFNSTCIFNYCNNENHSMRMYVWNGKWVENFDYDLYVIRNGDTILIDYR
jgi:hypothetical protein